MSVILPLSCGRNLITASVRAAVLLLPIDQRQRYREEWNADVEVVAAEQGVPAALWWALGIVVGALRRARAGERARHWNRQHLGHAGPVGGLVGSVFGLAFAVTDGAATGVAAAIGMSLVVAISLAVGAKIIDGLSVGMLIGTSLGASVELLVGVAAGLTSGLTVGAVIALLGRIGREPLQPI